MKYPYQVYYTYRTKVSQKRVNDLQDRIFDYLEEKYAQPTGYSHMLGRQSEMSFCDGLTQDLEFKYYSDVKEFTTWLKKIREICDIYFFKWDKGKIQYHRQIV